MRVRAREEGLTLTHAGALAMAIRKGIFSAQLIRRHSAAFLLVATAPPSPLHAIRPRGSLDGAV